MPFLTSTVLANLLTLMRFELQSTPSLEPHLRLPVTVNQFGVGAFRATRRPLRPNGTEPVSSCERPEL